jgi:membrane protein implicated in regulation of membrane protease activity
LYLAALIFGLGTFVIQLLFSPHDSPHGAEPSFLEVGADADGHLAGDHLASDAHTHADMALAPAHAHGDWASIFLSLRFYMFAAIAFGVVGAPATWLRVSTPALTLVVALALAFVVGVLASLGFRALGRQTLSSGAGPSELVGHVGRVLVGCEPGGRGKVRLNVRGQIIDYIATTDEARLVPGATVIVQEVHPERLHVCAAPIELLPE